MLSMNVKRGVALGASGLLTVVVTGAVPVSASAPPSARSSPRVQFSLSFPRAVLNQATDGRAYVIVSTDSSSQPRTQTDIVGGAPFWGTDVHGLTPGARVVVSDDAPGVYGFPLRSLNQLAPGRYYVQAFLNRYETFHRSDGSTVSLHMPCGDGHDIFNSPGNLFSTPQWVTISARPGPATTLSLDQQVPLPSPTPKGGTCQQGNPPDTAHVKHIKILSPSLTTFWGRPMYVAANVLLPAGYTSAKSARYPVEYHFDHFTTDAPHGFTEDGSNTFSSSWLSGQGPQFISVEIREENPFYDSSYVTNSPNLGPYGTATAHELVPAIDHAFRTVDAPWARITSGGSTGGWEALASLVYYPDVFGETFAGYPDPVDLHREQLVNTYDDANAYYKKAGLQNVLQPDARSPEGDIAYQDADENHYELAVGTHHRSAGAWDTWDAVYGPQGTDGYPADPWDKQTGAINHAVTARWKPKDLTNYVRSHWSTLGRQLDGKIYVYVGDTDTYYLNDAVQLFQTMLDEQTAPVAHSTFVYGRAQPHGWSPYTPEQWFAVYAEYLRQHGHPLNSLARTLTTQGWNVPAGDPANLAGITMKPLHNGIPSR